MITGEDVWKSWAELIALFLLVAGFFIAFFMKNAAFTYFVVFLAGILAGRVYFQKKGKKPIFPFVLIIIGFLVGYTLGAFSANRIVVIILFLIAWALSLWLHREGYIPA